MEYEVKVASLTKELEMRGIGYEREGRYFVDVLQAAYLTEIGKAKYEDAKEEIAKSKKLQAVYAVFKDLRGKMHVANYIEKDDVILAYEKGMIPKHAESKFAVKVLAKGEASLEKMLELRNEIRKVRKDFIIAIVGEKVEYFKFQELEM